MSLNGDIISKILRSVELDGITLANAGCVSSEFWSIARQESLWEEKCCSLWPSIGDKDVKELISSSLGGFKKFYADCFPVIVYDGDYKTLLQDRKEVHTGVHSDFVWVVDVVYKNKPIYSKVIWGIPSADDFPSLFSDYPFKMELINYCDVLYDKHSFGDCQLQTLFLQGNGHRFWGQLMENIRLSWILINKRTGQAVNLSSWRPLVGNIEWPSHKDFVLGFGSILPAYNIFPSKFVQCGLVMKCRVSDGDHASLNITELSMELEDMMGVRVNGRKSVVILERALGCRRSKDRNQILQSYQQYLIEKSRLRETIKMRSEGCSVDTVSILSGIVVFASFSYFIFKWKGLIF